MDRPVILFKDDMGQFVGQKVAILDRAGGTVDDQDGSPSSLRERDPVHHGGDLFRSWRLLLG
ncbi:hypothetical protein JCM17478_17660 [Thermopirellula anaerolimosa]